MAGMQRSFDAPLPGQSLTKMPGSTAMEKPPQFVKEEEALDYFWNVILENPKTVTKLMVLLKGGLAVTEIVNTLLFTGVAAGKWNLDLAFLMYQEVSWMIEALAKVRNIKYTFKRINPEYANFLYQYKDYITAPEDEPIEQATKSLFSGLKKV